MSLRPTPAPVRIPLDDAIVARFERDLPAIVAFREQRMTPGHRTWGIEALGYGLLTLAGMAWWQWSPMLVFVHLLVMQWIALLAEGVVLAQLARRGVARLVAVSRVMRFVSTVLGALQARARDPASIALIDAGALPDRAGTDADQQPPGNLLATMLFFGVIATGIAIAALIYADGALRDELLAQPVALGVLGAASVIQLLTRWRALMRPPLAGASWNVEFMPGMRLFGVVLLALLSPGALQAPDEVRMWAMVVCGAIAAWGGVALFGVRAERVETQRLRRAMRVA